MYNENSNRIRAMKSSPRKRSLKSTNTMTIGIHSHKNLTTTLKGMSKNKYSASLTQLYLVKFKYSYFVIDFKMQ